MYCGVETVIGFSTEILSTDAETFFNEFFEQTIVEGRNVTDALALLDEGDYSDCQLLHFVKPGGNEYIYLTN